MEEIFAGIMVADALQRQNTESALNDMKRKGLESDLENLKKENREKEAVRRVNDNFAQQQAQRTQDQLQLAKESKGKLIRENMKLEGELNFYKKLVAMNPATVADYSPEFKKEYMRECDLLSEWMMAQKGFKDIANKFGEKLGYSEQEVRKMAMTSGIDVMTKEANERKAKGEMQGDYDQYNVERVERVKVKLTAKFLK